MVAYTLLSARLEPTSRELRFFRTSGGREPFWDWYDGLRGHVIQARVITRLDRLEEGNLGVHRGLGEGVTELILDFGPGYRIYFGEDGPRIVLLLVAGDKKTQHRDIKKAKEYWISYRTGRMGK